MSTLSKIGIVCLCFLTSCGQRTASQSSHLSEQQVIEINEAFDRLDRILENQAPQIFSKLESGASIEDLDKLRNFLGGNQVAVLERWFSWHNGAGETLLPGGLPLSIDRAIEDAIILQSLPFVPEIRRNAMTILSNSAGDGFFLDVNTDSPLVFHHLLEQPEQPVWFGTLAEFVDFIATGFESGILFENEEGRFETDEAKYEEMMSEYLERATKWN